MDNQDEATRNADMANGVFRTAFEQAAAPMAVLDLNSRRVVHVNDALLKYTVFSREHLEGARISEMKFTVRQQDQEEFLSLLKPNVPIDDFSTWVRASGGEHRFVSASVRPLDFAGGSVCVLVLADITERRLAQENLLNKEERLRLALEGGRLGLWDYFPANGYFAYDSNWLEIQGLAPGALLNTMDAILGRIHSDDVAPVKTQIESVEQGQRRLVDLTFRTQYGDDEEGQQWIWIMVRGKVSEEDGAGRALRLTGVIQDVTKRQNALESLIKREAQGKLASQIAHLGYWEAYPQTHEMFISSELCELVGLEQVEGRVATASLEHMIVDDDLSMMKDEFSRCVANDEPYVADIRVRANRGEVILQFRAVHIKNEQGDYAYSVGIAQDITDMRSVERALVASERRYRSLYENMNEMLVMHHIVFDERGDPVDYRITGCNEAFERITGIRREDAEGRLASEVYGVTPPPYLEQYAVVAITGEPARFESHYKAMDKFFSISVVSPGKNIFATITTDITAQKLAERAARLSHFVLENSELPVAFLDRFSIMDYANHAMRKLLCMEKAGRLKYSAVDMRFADGSFDVFWEDLRQEHVLRYSSSLVLSSGSAAIPVEVICSYLEQDGKGICCIYVQDVSERLADREQRLALERQLQMSQKMEAVGRLAGGIAHDFNNLLHVILGYGEMLAESAQGEAVNHLREITKAGRRAMGLIDQLLAFSRRESKPSDRLQLNDLIRDIMSLLERVLGEDIEIQFDPASGLREIEADYSQMEQILLNLGVNAREAMASGGTIQIKTDNYTLSESEASARQIVPGDYVLLHFSDTGHGMDLETQARIFEPFFTTKSVGKGSGLGLATVYAIVEKAGGFIGVTSAPEQGTAFDIYFPTLPHIDKMDA